jgi:hypothetical protein
MKLQLTITPQTALKMGKDTTGEHEIDIDPVRLTAQQRSTLAAHVDDGGRITRPANILGVSDLPEPSEAALLVWLDEIAAAQAQYDQEEHKRAEQRSTRLAEEEAAAIAAEDAALKVYFSSKDRLVGLRYRGRDNGGYGMAFVSNKIRELTSVTANAHIVWLYHLSRKGAAELAADWKRKCRFEQEAEEAKEAAKKAKAKAKDAYLAAWIKEHGSESMRERQDDNLLPRQEAITAMANSILDPCGPAFEYDECEARGCRWCQGQRTDTLSAAGYEVWRQMRLLLPEGSTHVFFIISPRDPDDFGECLDGPRHLPPVEAVKLNVPCGPFQFSRMIRLADCNG